MESYVQIRSRREETNPFRQKSFSLFHNNNGINTITNNNNGNINSNARPFTSKHRVADAVDKNGSSDQILIKSRNANECRTSEVSLSKNNRLLRGEEDYEQHQRHYERENALRLLKSLKLANSKTTEADSTVFLQKTATSSILSSKLSYLQNSRNTYSDLSGSGGIILRVKTAVHESNRRGAFLPNADNEYPANSGDVESIVHLNSNSQRQNLYDLSLRYSQQHHHNQLQSQLLQRIDRNTTTITTGGSLLKPHNTHNTHNTTSQQSSAQIVKQLPRAHRPKTVSEFFMRPMPKREDMNTVENLVPTSNHSLHVARHNATTSLAVKKARRMQSAKPKEITTGVTLPATDLETGSSSNATRMKVISDVDLKKFKNLEQFYIKKMHEFGFEELTHQSTNKLLSRSEPDYAAMNADPLSVQKSKTLETAAALTQHRAVSSRHPMPSSRKKSSKEVLFHRSMEEKRVVIADPKNELSPEEGLKAVNSDLLINASSIISTDSVTSLNNKKPGAIVNQVIDDVVRTKKNPARHSAKYYSPSLIILPELEEIPSSFVSQNVSLFEKENSNLNLAVTSSSTGVSPSTIAYLTQKSNSKKQLQQQQLQQQQNTNSTQSETTGNQTNNMNRVLRVTQSTELTLPPILESQVVPVSHHNKQTGPPSSANKSNSRVDSGIVTDIPPGGSNKTNWTQSTNGSEQDYDNHQHMKGSQNNGNNVITTIELVETSTTNGNPTGIMRKNTTAGSGSSLNPYGKTSPSTQTKLNGHATPRKISIQIPATTITKQQLFKTAATNETKYVDICEKLNTLNEVNNYFISNNNADNSNSSRDKSNKRPNLDRSHSNNQIAVNSDANGSTTTNTNKLFNARVKSAFRDSRDHRESILVTPHRQQQLNRQNTNLSSVRNEQFTSSMGDNANNNNNKNPRRTSVNTNTTANGGRPQQQPVAKPRNKPEAKIINLHRLNTKIAAGDSSNLPGSTEPQQRANDIASNATATKTRVIIINDTTTPRPKTGGTVSRPKTAAMSTTTPSINNASNQVMLKLTARHTSTEMSTSKVNVDPSQAIGGHTVTTAARSYCHIPNPELSIAQTLAQINAATATNNNNGMESNENGLSEFTLQRILKWLEDMEKCTSMIKPPSQLVWSEASVAGSAQPKRSRHAAGPNFQHLFGEKHGGGGDEFGLSDYDSFDEQVVEYNRIVDKTFHIVHSED